MDAGVFYFTSLWPLSNQLNQRMNEGRIQGKDQDKGQISGQSVRGSAKERSGSRCGKARRYQGYWMGISMTRFQKRCKTDGREGGLSWSEMGAAALLLTAFIGLLLPSHPCSVSVHVLCIPLPSLTSPAHLHSDLASRLIFLEQ